MMGVRLLPIILLFAATATARAEKLPANVQSFFEKHCVSCHDNANAKAKLSIEALKPEFDRPEWVRIHDRVKSSEMPPKTKSQPTQAEREVVVKWLSQELNTAFVARQKNEGRVLFRRMNRREYETTIHDLLGITIPLQGMLPEDNLTNGFDTVSRGLETSATHLLRFQQAADAAIEAALPKWPITNNLHRWTGRQFLDSRPKPNREGTAPFVRFEGDSIVLCALLYKHGSVTTPHTPAPGRYRVRVSVRALQNEGKSIPVLFGKISSDRFAHEKLQHLLDIQDAPADKSRVLEIEAILPAGEQVYVEGLGLPFFQDLKKKRNGEAVGEDFKGPGLVVDWIELQGPLDAGVGYQHLFGELPQVPSRFWKDTVDGKPVKDDWRKWSVPGEYSKYPLTPVSREPKKDAERLVRAFLPLAFRRPPTEVQAAHYVKIVHDQLDAGERLDEAMRAGYKAILCSPYFLNYIENPGRLDNHAIAARLARFLWSSMPDQELLDTAAKGELTKPDVLKAQTERMLKDPKAKRFARDFTDQWLDLGKILDMKPDEIYLEYDDMLAWSMPLETRKFFGEVLAQDLPISSFIHSDWTFLNSRLGKHYGIPDIEGLELRKVPLKPESHRGGVITHASLLKLTTNASYTSPIKRGAWMLEKMIGTPPPPPPPDVKAVEPDIRGATTIREQLTKHKNVAVCASCHNRIDPPGFALESFDVVGGWRERYRVKQGGGPGNQYVDLPGYGGRKVWLAKPVQADGETADGQKFRDIDEYKQIVLKDPDQLTRNLAEKLIIYATGAEIDFADRAVVEQIVRDVRDRQHGFRSLIHAVIQSPVFLHK
ncbi:MAG: DUF1592 domain-containing protein [Planctomycetes bacterium]|nr:DUF1592 domain-containing protein [Planctomycetota bacterium]